MPIPSYHDYPRDAKGRYLIKNPAQFSSDMDKFHTKTALLARDDLRAAGCTPKKLLYLLKKLRTSPDSSVAVGNHKFRIRPLRMAGRATVYLHEFEVRTLVSYFQRKNEVNAKKVSYRRKFADAEVRIATLEEELKKEHEKKEEAHASHLKTVEAALPYIQSLHGSIVSFKETWGNLSTGGGYPHDLDSIELRASRLLTVWGEFIDYMKKQGEQKAK